MTRTLLILAVWFAAAIAAGASGVLTRVPVPPPAIAVILTFALLLLVRQSVGVRVVRS